SDAEGPGSPRVIRSRPMSIRVTSLRLALRGSLSLCLATASYGCAADDTSGDADASTSSASAGTTGASASSTSEDTAEASSSTTGDPTAADSSSTGSGTTEPTIGCTPGEPCCNDAGEYEECFVDGNSGLAWELVPMGGNPNV